MFQLRDQKPVLGRSPEAAIGSSAAPVEEGLTLDPESQLVSNGERLTFGREKDRHWRAERVEKLKRRVAHADWIEHLGKQCCVAAGVVSGLMTGVLVFTLVLRLAQIGTDRTVPIVFGILLSVTALCWVLLLTAGSMLILGGRRWRAGVEGHVQVYGAEGPSPPVISAWEPQESHSPERRLQLEIDAAFTREAAARDQSVRLWVRCGQGSVVVLGLLLLLWCILPVMVLLTFCVLVAAGCMLGIVHPAVSGIVIWNWVARKRLLETARREGLADRDPAKS